MLYVEHKPGPPLNRVVRLFWYVRTRGLDHGRERILPSGCAQIILNLSRDYLHDCPDGLLARRVKPALIVGPRSVQEMVETSDLEDLIGMVIAPGCLPGLIRDRADAFRNCCVALEDVWGGDERSLREQLREISAPKNRLVWLERVVAERWRRSQFTCHPAVETALREFQRAPMLTTTAEVRRLSGWSERRFSQVFREQVGFTPKTWCRIQRFQEVMRRLRAGGEVRWAELAAECGFYDQAHFANEFRAFSGINATTYLANRVERWANHVRTD